jgi:surface antigen
VLNENPGLNSSLNWDDARLAEETAAGMRDLARTVTEAPPLRLAAAPDELGVLRLRPSRPRWHGRRLRTWIVPAAAAVTVAAVAIALVLVRNIPNGRVPSPAASPSPTTPVNPPTARDVPEYYVAYMQGDRPYLLVQNTLTGKQYGHVPSPPGVYLNAVYGGSAGNRTWLVQGTNVQSPHVTDWYILTIAPGTENPLEMGSAGIPVRESPAGAALSPDGKEVAVAVNGSPAALRVYSLRTGALLRTWPAAGKFAAHSLNLSGERAGLALRWSPDGSHLGFAWNAKEIRALDVAAPDGNLVTRSTSLLAIGPTYSGIGTAFICHAWQGWSLLGGGNGVLCAGSVDTSGVSRMVGQKPLHGVVGSVLEKHFADGGTNTCMTAVAPLKATKAGPEDGAYLGWANADGTVVIGSTIADGKTRFGIFRQDRFSALPALPGAGALVPVGVLDGADVW